MRFKLLPIMFHVLSIFTVICLLATQQVVAEENTVVKQTHIHIEQGVVYCDVQTFNQESYILKVLGGGSPMTIYWQFELLKKSTYWICRSIWQRQTTPPSSASIPTCCVDRRTIFGLLSPTWRHWRLTADFYLRFLCLQSMEHFRRWKRISLDRLFYLFVRLHYYYSFFI